MLETPSYSQDRESQDGDFVKEEEAQPPMHLPSYHLAQLNTPPQVSNPFKRPFQADIITPLTTSQPAQPMPVPKRRKSSVRAEQWHPSEADFLLLKLKDEESLPWKGIAQQFHDMGRGEFRVPTLQMRYKRLKEKMRVWDAEDVRLITWSPQSMC